MLLKKFMDVDAISVLTPSWRHPQELRHDRRPTLRRKLAGTIRRGCPRVGNASDDRREPRNYLKPKVPYWNMPRQVSTGSEVRSLLHPPLSRSRFSKLLLVHEFG